MKYLPLIFLFISFVSNAQDEIFLRNPSFEEGKARIGRTPALWFNCGFEGESEPDVFPIPDNVFKVTAKAVHGEQYLGLVVRENETWEAIGQRLSTPLQGGKFYTFSLKLARSPMYISKARKKNKQVSNEDVNYASPCKLRIWGENQYCVKSELLAESPLIINSRWLEFTFEFAPKEDLLYLTFETFYKTPVLFPTNGNLLVDDLSSILETDTTGRAYADSLYEAAKAEKMLALKAERQQRKTEQVEREKTEVVKKGEKEKEKQEVRRLDPLKISSNAQLTEINQSFFAEQTSYLIFRKGNVSLENASIQALKEIVTKLKENPDYKVIFNLKGSNSLIKNSRRNHIRDLLEEQGFPNTRYSFNIPTVRVPIFKGGSRDVEVLIY